MEATAEQSCVWLVELKAEGLKGDDILYVLVEKRISPLQQRSCAIWQMSGPMDQHRMSTFELTKESIFRRAKAISDQKTLKIDWQYGKVPYDRAHPPPSVRFRTTLLHLYLSVFIRGTNYFLRISSGTSLAEPGKMPIGLNPHGAWTEQSRTRRITTPRLIFRSLPPTLGVRFPSSPWTPIVRVMTAGS